VDAQAIQPGRYHVVPRTLVFVRHRDKVLMVRRAAGRGVWPGRYNGAGGHVEAGEGLADAARREVHEETGLAVHTLRLAGLLHVTDARASCGVLVSVFTAATDDPALRSSAEGAAEWVDLTAVPALDVVPDLAALLPRLWPAHPEGPFLAVATGDGQVTISG
jgi:8-oxo-dGTP diphosphatase